MDLPDQQVVVVRVFLVRNQIFIDQFRAALQLCML